MKRAKRTEVEGTIFAIEGGIAFINLPRKQIWVPSKYMRIGDRVRVIVERLAPRPATAPGKRGK